MALFSFGQSIKRKFSRSKRGVGDHGMLAKKTASSLSTINQRFVFPENDIQNKGFFKDEISEDKRRVSKIIFDHASLRQESRSTEDNFVSKAIFKRQKEDIAKKKISCDVAVGPDLSIKLKEKSTQTKSDVRHRYTDTKDLIASLETKSSKHDVRVKGSPKNPEDAEMLTKMWKDEWLNALHTKNHCNILAEIKSLSNSSIKSDLPTPKRIEHKTQLAKKQHELQESEKEGTKSDTNKFDVNFALDCFPDFTENCSLVSRFVTKKLYSKLKDVRSPTNAIGLGQIIQQGIMNAKDERCIGVTACDDESYSYFSELFVPIIEEIRPEYNKEEIMQKVLLKSVDEQLKAIDVIESNFIFEMRITMKKSIKNFPFTSHCNKNERRIIQTILANACQNINGELSGNCCLLDHITSDEQIMVKDEEKKLNNKLKSASWKSAGITRDWPDGRAIFKGGKQDQLSIIINGEEHLAMSLSIYDGDLKNSLKLLLDVEEQIKISISKFGLEFAWSDQLGNLNTFLTHLGLGCCVVSRVLFPSLDGKVEQKRILKKFNLRSNRGSISKKQGYEISSFTQFGVTEVDLIEQMTKALNCMTAIEKRLQNGEDFYDVMQKYDVQ